MKIDVFHIAKLANVPIKKEEKEKLEKQLKETLEYIEILDKIDTKNIKPTNQVTGLENIVKEDKASFSLSQEEVLKNANSTYNGFFKTKAILENE